MRIIFKKLRARMIIGCILAIIALLAVSVFVFIIQPSFGRTPRGERLEKSSEISQLQKRSISESA